MDARIILGVQPIDVVGAMRQGNSAAIETNAIRQQNALADLYRTQGQGLMRGNPQSLNALARLDPVQAQNMSISQQELDIKYAEAKRQAADAARTLDENQRKAQAEKLSNILRGAASFYAKGDQQGYTAWLQQNGVDPAQYSFDAFPAHAATVTGVLDALKEFTPEAPKPQSPQAKFEADKKAGLLPPDAVYKSDAPSVTVNNGGGKFEEAFAKADADALASVANAGMAAIRNQGRIDQLDALLSSAPSGSMGAIKQVAGEWGIPTDGLNEIQSAQAIINALVPEQRQPGSGPMSDADLALFKQSLPRIINQPGGNKIIVDTMRAIAQYDAEGAKIVQDLRAGRIDRATAFDQLQNRANPLANVNKPSLADSNIPADAIQLLRQNDSPDYRKMFDEVFGQGAAARALGGN